MKDESSAGSLTFNELKNVFQRVRDELGRPIDILGMDNCLMSMAEICYELRGLAEIVVGCESFSPASGWPYREVLERLANDFVSPNLQPQQSLLEEAAKEGVYQLLLKLLARGVVSHTVGFEYRESGNTARVDRRARKSDGAAVGR
jgi:hypothetical protein